MQYTTPSCRIKDEWPRYEGPYLVQGGPLVQDCEADFNANASVHPCGGRANEDVLLAPVPPCRIKAIARAIDACKLVVVLASATYGADGTDAFATLEGARGTRSRLINCRR